MTDFTQVLIVGALSAGIIRLSIGQFIIYTTARGWVWKFSRFDKEDENLLKAYETGVRAGIRLEKMRYNYASVVEPEQSE